MYMEDTIAAIATPPGEGGIGIVRISGEKAEEILKNIFVTKSGARKQTFKDRYFYYGKILDEYLAKSFGTTYKYLRYKNDLY